jgi:hypothetical protein
VPLINEEQTNQAEEKKDSLAIFFILLVIVLAILLVHLLIKYQIRFMPESLAIVLLGLSVIKTTDNSPILQALSSVLSSPKRVGIGVKWNSSTPQFSSSSSYHQSFSRVATICTKATSLPTSFQFCCSPSLAPPFRHSLWASFSTFLDRFYT